MCGDVRCHLAIVRVGSNRQEYAVDGARHGSELRDDHHHLAKHFDRDCDRVCVWRGRWCGGRFDHHHGDGWREDWHLDRHRDPRPGSGREFDGSGSAGGGFSLNRD